MTITRESFLCPPPPPLTIHLFLSRFAILIRFPLCFPLHHLGNVAKASSPPFLTSIATVSPQHMVPLQAPVPHMAGKPQKLSSHPSNMMDHVPRICYLITEGCNVNNKIYRCQGISGSINRALKRQASKVTKLKLHAVMDGSSHRQVNSTFN
jgi:hypothetical protein